MTEPDLPAWRRSTRGETRWPAMIVVVGTLALQVGLPGDIVVKPWWLLPAISVLLVGALLLVNPGRMDEFSRIERIISLLIVLGVTVVNVASAAQLVYGILHGSLGNRAGAVLISGGIVYWTNIVVFSLWYWEFDRGGPARRALGNDDEMDLQFPQLSDPKMAKSWEPSYLDYLYFSFTNSAAFSPTDVLPLKVWAKMTMMVQAIISLILALLVVAWAINSLH